jgi:hypothetical protein
MERSEAQSLNYFLQAIEKDEYRASSGIAAKGANG